MNTISDNYFETREDLCVEILKIVEHPNGIVKHPNGIDRIQTTVDLIIQNMKHLTVEYIEPPKKTLYKCPHIECDCHPDKIKASLKYRQKRDAGLIKKTPVDKLKNQEYYKNNRERLLSNATDRNSNRKQELIEYNAKYYKDQRQLMSDTKKEMKRLQNELDKLNPLKIEAKKRYSKTYLDKKRLNIITDRERLYEIDL